MHRRFRSGDYDFGVIPILNAGKGFGAQSRIRVPRNIPCHANVCIHIGNENVGVSE